MTTITPPRKLTRIQAADYLGVRESTLRAWATRKQGPPIYRAGAKVWYLQSALDEWIASRTTHHRQDTKGGQR